MTYKKLSSRIVPLVLGVVLAGSSALPAFALTRFLKNSSSTGQASSARVANLLSRATQEIDRRIAALNTLASRTQSMQKLSDTEKNNISSAIQSQISDMMTLKAKVEGDSDVATLRADAESITKSYRIYALVIPQGAIVAAADRVMTIADAMTTVGQKIQTRLSSAQSSGQDVASLQSAMADFTAKVSDATTQAGNAVSGVSSLVPDQGDPAKLQANTAALKDARSKIKTATGDLEAARKDAGTIIKALQALGRKASAASTTTP